MIKLMPAHIEQGRIVTDAPLPAADDLRSITILLEFKGTEPRLAKEEAVSRLTGLLKDLENPESLQEDYVRYLAEKYG